MKKKEICFVHDNCTKYFTFTKFIEVKEGPLDKLQLLINIQDKHLLEAVNSPFSLKKVRHSIPNSLSDVHINKIGYHRGCFQKFTENLNRVAGNKSPNQPLLKIRSPKKDLQIKGFYLLQNVCTSRS